MSSTMSVIYVPDTGHALAAVCRAADPTASLDLASLGSAALIVTNESRVNPAPAPGAQGEMFYLPYSILKATGVPVPLDEGLLSRPLNYVVDNDVPQNVFGPPSPPPAPLGTATLSSNQIAIVLTVVPFPLPQDLKIWVQVQEQQPIDPANPEIRISSRTITANTTPTDAAKLIVVLTGSPGGTPMPLPTGRTYSILLLIAEYPALFDTQAI